MKKLSREEKERRYLRSNQDRNRKISDIVTTTSSVPLFCATQKALGRGGEKPITIPSALLGVGSAILGSNLLGETTKLGLDSRDYLKAKRLTDEDLNKKLQTKTNNNMKKKSKKYSIIMTEDELALFSELQKQKETKLKPMDRFNVLSYKLSGKRGRDEYRDILEGNTENMIKRDVKRGAIITGVGTLAGAGLGAYLRKGEGAKKMLKAAGKSGLAGLALGTGLTAGRVGADYVDSKINKAIDKRSKRARENKERELDLIDVAEGKLSKDQFANKWYKK